MSAIADQILAAFEPTEIRGVTIDREAAHHGEPAIDVTVICVGGRTVTGTFIKDGREGFGGVDFDGRKDVAGLMISKVRAVLDGRAE